MRFVLQLLGWSGEFPESSWWEPLHVRGRDLGMLRGDVLVLGARGLQEADPVAVARWAALGRRRVLGVLDGIDGSELEAWLGLGMTSLSGAMQLVRRERLRAALERTCQELALGFLRWPHAPGDWLPLEVRRPSAGSEADLALRALATHRPVHDIEEWAVSVGMKYRRLLARVHAATFLKPRELSQLFVLRVVELGSEWRANRSDLAHLLGYADDSALAHAAIRGREVRRRLRRRRASGGGKEWLIAGWA